MQNSILSNSDLAFDPTQEPEISFLVKQMLMGSVKNIDSLNLAISKEDEMLIFLLEILNLSKEEAVLGYYKIASNCLNTLKQIINWKIGEFANVRSYLDFASGYGRLTRLLVQEIHPEKLWIADIYEGGVEFQMQQFGVNGIVSTTLPEQLHISQNFDVISVISLFSHLPERTFLGWLKKLYDLLEDQGILMFSTHGVDLLPPNVPLSHQGIAFITQSESRSLDTQEYGSTYVTEAYVNQAVAQVTNGQGKVHLLEKAINNHQDLYLVIKGEKQDFSSLQLRKEPLGHLDICTISSPNELSLAGWAATPNHDANIVAIKIYINGQLSQECVPSFARPDVAEHFGDEHYLNSGWQCSCFLDSSVDLQKAIIAVTVIDSLEPEHEHSIHVGQIA